MSYAELRDRTFASDAAFEAWLAEHPTAQFIVQKQQEAIELSNLAKAEEDELIAHIPKWKTSLTQEQAQRSLRAELHRTLHHAALMNCGNVFVAVEEDMEAISHTPLRVNRIDMGEAHAEQVVGQALFRETSGAVPSPRRNSWWSTSNRFRAPMRGTCVAARSSHFCDPWPRASNHSIDGMSAIFSATWR